jgi:hypothetical protein
MKARGDDDAPDETSLVRMYMDLTGSGESAARSVFMHVCCRDHEKACLAREYSVEGARLEEETRRSWGPIYSNKSEWMGKAIVSPVPG